MRSEYYVACVEDDQPVRTALVGLLEAFGFAVRPFSCAEDFLNSDHISQTCCLITDVKLGAMSGLQLLEHLGASGQNIPTIIISAYGDEILRAQALKAGAVAFLGKPIAAEVLMSSIELALKAKPQGA